MEQIKSLFDQTRDIYRVIEKVITYNISQENRLKAEISEYIVTESIEEQLEKLLTKMQAGVWELVRTFAAGGALTMTHTAESEPFATTEGLRALLIRLHEAGPEGWRRDPEAAQQRLRNRERSSGVDERVEVAAGRTGQRPRVVP